MSPQYEEVAYILNGFIFTVGDFIEAEKKVSLAEYQPERHSHLRLNCVTVDSSYYFFFFFILAI